MKGPKVLQVVENKSIAAGIYRLELYELCQGCCRDSFPPKCGGDKFPLRRPISLSYAKARRAP